MESIEYKWKEAADKNAVLAFLDIVISGFAQITFNVHPVCGLLLIIAAFIASPIQAISGLWAVLIAAGIIYAAGIPMGQAREGLYTINPALLGLAIPMVSNQNDPAALLQILLLSAIGSVLCVLLTAGLRQILSTWKVSPLAVPYSVALMIMSSATYYFTALHPEPLFTPAVAGLMQSDGAVWTLQSFATAVLNGLAQVIWMEDVPLAPLSGVIVLAAVCIASRIDAVMAVIAGVLATAAAIALGIGQGGVMLGLYGYNAILLSFVLFGRAYKMSVRSFVMTVILAVLTVPFAAGLKPLLAVVGAPAAAFPFAIMGILAMLGQPFFKKLVYNEPKNWTIPEKSGR